jgi:hypothetical protein
MRYVDCAACQAKLPMNEAFSVAERTLCENCLKQFVGQSEHRVGQGEVKRLRDPTVCAQCKTDGGEGDLSQLAGLPICTPCENFFRNRPYPKWLKVSLAVFLCVALGAFIYNMRFFLAYVELIQGGHAMERGDIAKAAGLYESASKRLPEIPELSTIPTLYKAQQLIAEDKDEDALTLLHGANGHASQNMRNAFRPVELKAEMGFAFNHHDYDQFLERAKLVEQMNPDDELAIATVASANACKYATTGDQSY